MQAEPRPSAPSNEPEAAATTQPADKLDRIWSQLSDADRQVLLGHTHPSLNAIDKVELARAIRKHGSLIRRWRWRRRGQ